MDVEAMSRARYIGSKARIAGRIVELLGPPKPAFFVDVFSGTGAVAREAALRGWCVRANDHLVSSSMATSAQLLSSADVPFYNCGGYSRALAELSNVAPQDGFVWKEYSPSGASRSGQIRLYFTEENARMIDAVRAEIETWFARQQISFAERTLLIADLLSATNRVANIAGTYGCFLSSWCDAALQSLKLQPRALLPASRPHIVTTVDAFDVRCAGDDVVYLDPPYTKRQYAAYYHLLETIAIGDAPQVTGVTGLRPWEQKSSPFCFRRLALSRLIALVAKLESRRFAISYSNEGQIEIPGLIAALEKLGELRVLELGEVGRYRPNSVARRNGSAVTEYLMIVDRDRAPATTYELAGQLRFYECAETF